MENASKALLIAAAILVVILIITLGISVYRMAASSVGKVNLTEQEIAAFNGKFTVYCGKNKRASEVQALMESVLASNIANTDTKVSVIVGTTTVLATTATSMPTDTKLNNSKVYNVTYSTNSKSGLIESVTATVVE